MFVQQESAVGVVDVSQAQPRWPTFSIEKVSVAVAKAALAELSEKRQLSYTGGLIEELYEMHIAVVQEVDGR